MSLLAKKFVFKFSCEPSLRPFIKQILDGEYDIKYIDSTNNIGRVIDLGGNIGAFSFWAMQRWPKCQVLAVEADPKNCDAYIRHLTDSGIPKERYHLINAAITSDANTTITLYRSKINSGMTSIKASLAGDNAEPFVAPTFHPDRLPDCDMLKADIEGCEIDVLTTYLANHTPPQLISFEYHHRDDRYVLEDLLKSRYTLCSGNIVHIHIGTLNFLRTDCITYV